MHACLFDVLHDATDEHLLAIGEAIHVDFDRMIQEVIEQYGRIVADLDRLAHVTLKVDLLVHDLHRAPAQHITGAHDERIADILCVGKRLAFRARRAVGRLAQVELGQQLLEALAIFCHVDRFGARADDRNAVGFQCAGKLERSLAAILHDDADGLLNVHDLEHILEGNRLEVEAIRGVVIGRDCFRIAVDHDGLEAVLAQRQRCMHAAVVELDALPDAVRAAAEHDDLLSVSGLGLALLLVGRIQIGGVGRELCRAGVDPLVDGSHIELVPQLADLGFADIKQESQATIGEPAALQVPERLVIEIAECLLFEREFDIDDFLDLREKPGIDARELVHFLKRESLREGVTHIPDALRARFSELDLDFFPIRRLLVQAIDADLEPAQCFLERLLERAPNGHHLAHGLHLGRQPRVGRRKFLERKAGHLGDNIVNRRLKRCRGRAARDFILQFVQRVADRKARRDLRDRETGGLRGQSGRARHPGIHLDHDHPAVGRVDRELDVRASRIDTDFTQHRDRCVSHQLVLFIGQRLGRRHRDRVPGMHAHRVEVFD